MRTSCSTGVLEGGRAGALGCGRSRLDSTLAGGGVALVLVSDLLREFCRSLGLKEGIEGASESIDLAALFFTILSEL